MKQYAERQAVVSPSIKRVLALSFSLSKFYMLVYKCMETFFLRFFIYDRQRERQRHRQREKQAPCREPDMRLSPGSPGSHPGPKAGNQVFLFYLIYLFTRDTQRERERETDRQTQAEGEAGSMQEA